MMMTGTSRLKGVHIHIKVIIEKHKSLAYEIFLYTSNVIFFYWRKKWFECHKESNENGHI